MEQRAFGMTNLQWSKQSQTAQEVTVYIVYKSKSDDGVIDLRSERERFDNDGGGDVTMAITTLTM